LLTALSGVESFARSGLERLVEAAMLRAAMLLHVNPPDLSYGPLQIRLSTMRKILPDRDADPLLLLETCSARRIARSIIEHEVGVPLGQGSTLTRPQVLAAAAVFNGQSTTPSGSNAAGIVASRVYQEVVYHLFQQARFGG
jgi:hypothetical protein